MKEFQSYIDSIDHLDKRNRMEMILMHVSEKFPNLKREIKWNQPMFSDHGTFIIGFSITKNHIAVAPEAVVIRKFEDEIKKAGYVHTKEIFRIKWTDDVDFELLDNIIAFNIDDKKEMTKYWR